MIKKILGAIFLIPIVILLAFWGINFILGVLSGNISLIDYIANHKVIIGLVAAYFIYKFLNPFKKEA